MPPVRWKAIAPRLTEELGNAAWLTVTVPVNVAVTRSMSSTPSEVSGVPIFSVPALHGTLGGALPVHCAGFPENPMSYVPGSSVAEYFVPIGAMSNRDSSPPDIVKVTLPRVGAVLAMGAPSTVRLPVTFTVGTSRSSVPSDASVTPCLMVPELHGMTGGVAPPQ